MDVHGVARDVRVRGRSALARRFGVDTRALAALRVALGLLLLADLALRSRDLVAFYTDAGVLPRSALREQFPGFARLTLHAVSGAAWIQAVLFLVAAVFALALLVGYRTRLATVVSFLLLVSLHARNPLVLNAGDSLFRRLLLWGAFLPLGERWSVDALLDSEDDSPRRRVVSLASAALLLQVVLVYLVNGLVKLRGEHWLAGDAVRIVFSLDQLTVLLGDVLARYPLVLELFDRVWLVAVVGSVLLVVLTGRARAAFASLFVAMHLGMALTMRLGIFPFVSAASLLPFLPGSVWDAATRRLAPVTRAVDVDRWLGAQWNRLDRAWPNPLDRAVGALPTRSARVRTVPRAVQQWRRRLGPAVVACLLALVLVWNAASLGYASVPNGVESVADPTERRWDMFAPEPRSTDGWYVVPGRLESGGRVDALHREPVRWNRPPDVSDSFPSHGWLVYLLDLQRPGNEALRPHFADYLCRRWNENHEDDLTAVRVYYVEQPTRLDGPDPTNRVELGRYSCAPDRATGA